MWTRARLDAMWNTQAVKWFRKSRAVLSDA